MAAVEAALTARLPQITARITALVYYWWSLCVRLVDPTMHRDTITSRPLMIAAVARATQHAGQPPLSITSQHAHHHGIRHALTDVADFLDEIRRTAPQLTAIER